MGQIFAWNYDKTPWLSNKQFNTIIEEQGNLSLYSCDLSQVNDEATHQVLAVKAVFVK